MPSRTYAPTVGLSSWQSLLADPIKHWVRGASAFETAVLWERGARSARGLAPQLATLLDIAPAWHGSTVIAAFPEHRVALPGGSRASQNDVWAMLKGPTGLLSLAVEGKAGESFGETVGDWMKDSSAGRIERLEYLRRQLGLSEPVDPALRYQLLHRAASALIEAGRIGAVSAAMVVLSFRADQRSKDDFQRFCAAVGAGFAMATPLWARSVRQCPFFVAWLDIAPATDAEVAEATL
jgi:hypothetical protein